MFEALLPVRLVELLRRVDGQFAEQGELTLGPVTFFGARGATTDAEISLALMHERWPGMLPELVPFAIDAVGNTFCLVCSALYADPEKIPVVYWMYETGVAVPVASCFDRFLDWIGLAAEIGVRRGADDAMNVRHLRQVVTPQLEALGVSRDFFALTTSPVSPVGSLHLGMLRVDPTAAGSRIVAAHRAKEDHRSRDAILHARSSLKSFPGFLAAAWFLVTFPDAPSRVVGFRDLVRLLPDLLFCYRGDAMMPEFVDVPRPTFREIFDLIASASDPRDAEEDPVLSMILYDDAESADVWLRTAIDLANIGALDRAHTVALNGFHIATTRDARNHVLMFLEELYEALGWMRLREVAAFEIARCVRDDNA